MFFLLQNRTAEFIKKGTLIVIDANGVSHQFGDGTGTPVCVRLTDRSLHWKLALSPDPSVGEAYADGTLIMVRGSIYDLLCLIASQPSYDWGKGLIPVEGLRTLLNRANLSQGLHGDRDNIAHHYDLSSELYDLFLDSDRQYSCGYFENSDQSLEEAQLAKKRHLASKLALRPGMKVLDIGSGWAGLALYLAENCEVEVVGVTLSAEQHRVSVERVRDRGLQAKVDIRFLDYRCLDEKFDRIVSVGMFEHVGVSRYDQFFKKVHDLLTDDGVALLHTIGRSSGPAKTSPWIDRYIFPGGQIPALSEIMPTVEKSGLLLCDLEVLRLHYAQTLLEWRNRFVQNWDRAKKLYDGRFCRIWEFYLAASEVSFRYYGLNIFQIQFSKKLTSLPTLRTYMSDQESRLRQIDQGDHSRIPVAAE